MRENHDWHKGYKLGDVNFLLICGKLNKDLNKKEAGKPCIYIHYLLRDEKYIAWMWFKTEKERDEVWLNEIDDEFLEAIILVAVADDIDEPKKKTK